MTAYIENAATVIRLDDESQARTAFVNLVAQHGRDAATRIWIEATTIVEAEDPFDPPTRRAPDCDGFCGESYIDECEPCTSFEQARHPQRAPCQCPCGTVIPADQYEAILDHVDSCPVAAS